MFRKLLGAPIGGIFVSVGSILPMAVVALSDASLPADAAEHLAQRRFHRRVTWRPIGRNPEPDDSACPNLHMRSSGARFASVDRPMPAHTSVEHVPMSGEFCPRYVVPSLRNPRSAPFEPRGDRHMAMQAS